MLKTNGLQKIYKSKKSSPTIALDDVNITLPDKGMVFIIGKSGSGKSTFLQVSGGLDKKTAGELIISNKSMSEFKEKDYDSYRNTYLGFVFQEYNLIEQYNVYENISLALELQNKKTDHAKIDELLIKLDLKDLGKRKINELSGGQKQRVAIARALIKEPQIIFADEPTGNLDTKTGAEIMQLLKTISQDKLVVVVSHDLDSAQKYGDRVIEFSDGKVIHDTNPAVEETASTFKTIKSKLPTWAALKLALNNLKYKKIRLFFTTLLIILSLTLLGASLGLGNYDPDASHQDILKRSDLIYSAIYRNTKNPFVEMGEKYYNVIDQYEIDLSDDVIKKVEQANIENLMTSEMYLHKNSQITLNFKEKAPSDNYYETDNKETLIETLAMSNNHRGNFVNTNFKNFIFDKVVGRLPEKANEVVITYEVFNTIKQKGVLVYKADSKLIDEYFQPKTVEELIESKKEISVGHKPIVIVGVLRTIENDYAELNGKTRASLADKELNKIYQTYENWYRIMSKQIFVRSDFSDYLELEKGNNFNGASVGVTYTNFNVGKEEDNYAGFTNFVGLDKEITMLTNNGIKQVKSLNKNEIIISDNYLNALSKGKFKEELEKEADPDKFIKDYLTKNNIIGTKAEIRINDYIKQYNDDLAPEVLELTIVGYSINDSNEYINLDLVKEKLPEIKIRNMFINFYSSYDQIEKQLKEFPIREVPIASGTQYTTFLNLSRSTILIIAKVFQVAAIIVAVIAVLVFTNYITITISYSKKEIGILRALGARRSDVFKIFTYQSLMISMFAYIISIILIVISSNYINTLLKTQLPFDINIIILNPTLFIGLLLMVLLINIVACLIPVLKTTKLKPIDAILNR